MANTEIEKEKIVTERNKQTYEQKMQIEEQRHKNAMEELKFMAENKIKQYNQYINITRKKQKTTNPKVVTE